MIEDGVRIIGNVIIRTGVSISAPAELMAKDSLITIGSGCDIAAFVTISTADSHKRCLGLSETIERKPIHIGQRTFIGTGAVILGGCTIGDDCVIGAGVVLKNACIPPGSRVRAPAPIIEEYYYRRTL
jgi:carbonic anhydrase/acetyltransferase-like protein (isoleucine patch superfamily)